MTKLTNTTNSTDSHDTTTNSHKSVDCKKLWEDVSLGELLAMRGKPFKDWKEERKYLQEKWGKQGQQIDTKKGVNSEYSADTPQK